MFASLPSLILPSPNSFVLRWLFIFTEYFLLCLSKSNKHWRAKGLIYIWLPPFFKQNIESERETWQNLID